MGYYKSDIELISNTYKRKNLVITSGHKSVAYDENGKAYIDFTSGIGVNSLGFCDADWVEATSLQLKNIQHISNYYVTKPCVDLAEILVKATGYNKVFFCNSGAEAVEYAIKTARKYSNDKYGMGRSSIVTLKDSFHGRTMATLSATGQDVFHEHFFPFLEGFKYAEAGNLEDLISKIDETVCAVMVEVIQGEGGVNVLDDVYLDFVKKLCKDNDLLFIVDEVQTGIGRSGQLLASEGADLVTLAKGLGGGLPIGAVLISKKLAGTMTAGTHGSTFGGNPVVCAGAKVVLNKLLNDNMLSEILKKGEYMKEKLLKMKGVVSVCGKGLMIGIVLEKDNAGEVLDKAIDAGLLLLTAKNKVRLLPPLNIEYDEIDRGLDIFSKLI